MSEKFFIQGGKALRGTVRVSGSKNAALPILAASLLCTGESEISNLPEIHDVQAFLEILRSLGVSFENKNGTLVLSAENLLQKTQEFAHPHIKKMRASILLLAPLLLRWGAVRLPFPGGCVLGKRSAESHLKAFQAFGAEILETTNDLQLSASKGLKPARVVLPEISVTATENALMLAANLEGESEIRMAAAEPHVQNLCHFLISAGAKIEGIGSHTLKIRGSKNLKSGKIAITSDYLEAGTFILAGAITDGEVEIENVEEHHLDAFFEKLHEVGVEFAVDSEKKSVRIAPRKKELKATKIQTGVFPAFPTDLHPQFAVLLTQCQGTSQIFETLFERKFAYLLELEKMGANVEILNPHQFLIHGPTPLTGTPVASQDIRAGAAMLLAALAAAGTTEISNIHYIHRGYEDIEKKLQKLDAKIGLVSE